MAGCWVLAAEGLHAADIEIPGLIANETRTPAGREFFDAFLSSWQSLDPDGKWSLVINEKPAARGGSLVTISLGGSAIFQRFVSYNMRLARANGSDASVRVYSQVMSAELDRFMGDSELIGDGL
jgi:curli production assembly/transport component CsgE